MRQDKSLFRHKIFLALLSVNLLFLILMAVINYYQLSYNIKKNRYQEITTTENRVAETFRYLSTQQKDFTYEELKLIFKDRIFEMSDIFHVNINVYDLQGNLLTSNLKHSGILDRQILTSLKYSNSPVVKDSIIENKNLDIYNSYQYIKSSYKPIAILNIQKNINNESMISQSGLMIKQFFLIVILLMLLCGFVAWNISKSLTKKIEGISQKLESTNMTDLNQPIEYNGNDEIQPLVTSYNQMIDKLRQQASLLQKTEREEAWKEMAKQVAHEINNPLTPLRLTVQNFQRKYNPEDPDNEEKVKNMTKSVVHQIDIISSITKSFSDFAKMPVNNDMEIDMVETIRRTLDIFPPTVVSFATSTETLHYRMDSLYLTRIVTNIVKNGIQSAGNNEMRKISVNLKNHDDKILISIADNGKGIPEAIKDKIFEPNFTTKPLGMGLGLSMVKKIIEDYNGKIWFDTIPNVGTTFFIEFYK